MWTAAVLLLCASLANAKSLKATPEPDNSELCTTCTKTIDDLQLKWTNETTVAEILAQLDEKCDDKYNFKKKEICEKIAAVVVQIPPGIFAGINSLAWPVSLGLCATFNQCTTNCCVANAKPEQIHLSLAGTDRSIMGVSWVTLTGDQSQVRYGTDPSQLTSVNTGTSLTYTKAGWIGMIHRAVMTNLQEGTKYYYQVGADDNGSGWSDTYSFTTYTPGKEINYAVIADMAYDENSDNTVASLIDLVDAGQLDVVIHSGDISYADGYMPHFDDFMNKVQPIAARVPYQVSPGNHEFGYNFTAYKTRFFMPGQIDEGGSGDGMYYSWRYGHIHFTSMNSESPIDTAMFTDRELEWVQSDMSAVDRADTPWLIAHFHRPLYCARDLECGKLLMKVGGEDVLMRNKVDLVFTAHEHTYERTNQVYNFTNTAGAPVYLLQGASGNREGNNGNYPPLSELPDWVASVHNDIGYGILTESADGSTLKWSFYKSEGKEQLDTVTYTKN